MTNSFPELLTASRFYVELKLDGSDDHIDATFLKCEGFERTQELIEICEVTPNQWGKAKKGQVIRTKIPGNVKTKNIVLSRGMSNSMTLWQWFAAVEEGKWSEQLRNGALSIFDQGGKEQARFEFEQAWPTSYTASDFDAQSGEIEIEKLELAVSKFKRVKPENLTSATSKIVK